jgi:hypothetical protein
MEIFTSLLNFQLTASPVGFAGAVVSEELPGGAIYPTRNYYIINVYIIRRSIIVYAVYNLLPKHRRTPQNS